MRSERSTILEVGVDSVFHTILIFSIFLLIVGHNSPGGGFVGGLVAGAALVLRYVSGGQEEVRRFVPFEPETLFAVGILAATITGIVPAIAGATFLESEIWETDVPVLGTVKLSSTLFFDCGVYLVVVGLVLMILGVLGATEEEGDEPDEGEALVDGPAVDGAGSDTAGADAGGEDRS